MRISTSHSTGRTNPRVITPVHQNSFAPLNSDTDSDSDPSLPEEDFLPSDFSINISSSSISTSSSDNSNMSEPKDMTMKELQNLMEQLTPGSTTAKSSYTYTDVSNFQVTLGQ